MKKILAEYDKILQQYNPKAYTTLNAGLPNYVITEKLDSINIRNLDLVNVFEWRNGNNQSGYIVGVDNICSWGKLMPLAQALNIYSLYVSQQFWTSNFFPIIAEGGGTHILYNNNDLKLYIDAPNLILSKDPITIYDSLQSFFKTEISCYINGVYSISHENILEANYDLLFQISQKMNPTSAYWNE